MTRKHTSPVRGLAPDEAASYWLVRLDAEYVDQDELSAFEAWRSESPSNASAYDRARAAWDVFDDAEGDLHLNALRESALEVRPEPPRGLWYGAAAGIAASLIAVLAFNTNLAPTSSPPLPQVVTKAPILAPSPAIRSTGEFVTARGERRVVDLADGSVITLNTDSAIRFSIGGQRRLVRLLRGQALFEVAKDQRRPFVVQAADRQVTALGTVFEVRLDPNRMKVTLVEGRVVVDAISDRPRPGVPPILPTVLRPGQELVATIGTPQQLTSVDVEQQLRWRQGFVEFSDTPLTDAVREINRYSTQQIAIRDTTTGSLRVSGVFRTGNAERFAAIVGELLPVRSRVLPDDRIEISSVQP